MKFTELLENYFLFLWETFLYDVEVYSQGWMYYLLLIPAFFYTLFFMVKWGLLLAPFYFPFLIIMRIIALALIPQKYLHTIKETELKTPKD